MGNITHTNKSLLTAIIAANSADANNTLVSATAGKRIAVYAWVFNVTTAGSLTWFSATTALSGVMPYGVLGLDRQDIRADGEPWYLCATAEALKWTLTATMGIGGTLYYRLIDP